QLLFRRSWLKSSHAIQCVHFEEVSMDRAAWWTWSPVTYLAKIVLSLLSAALKRYLAGHRLADFSHLGWKVIEKPVDPDAGWRIWIIRDESEALCAFRRITPAQWNRNI